ncbi:alginate O-acetyltransferase [Pseudomonas sp. PDM16]|uniref:alginate O-acetyltransferase n=1 Tax=Pseudomonas sp. PDM16 TaxID=2769292 RepID=UPI001783717A|nr:alginate O-acetyltransferase [Pseudomonas sp. PDM16]MBD9416651.1 alginate O-acetyltransferase [Pseudomonas sp. PDM16]
MKVSLSARSSLALGLLLSASSAMAVQFPQYEIELIDGLCPAAANPGSYNTKELDFHSTLIDGRDGWLFRTKNDLRTDIGTTPEGYAQLKRFRDALKARGTELLIVFQPTKGLVVRNKLTPEWHAKFDYETARTNYIKTIENFRKAGIWAADYSPLFDEQGKQTDFFFKDDHHWTPRGAKDAARLTAEVLKQIPAYADMPKKEFVTKRVGILGSPGSSGEAAGKICNNTYDTEYVDRFATEPADESSGDSLFGDESTPEVVLVGTSNSGVAYNFAGYLEQYSGVQVLNMAVTGGGYESAMLQLLASEEFQKKPPKVVVWEFATHYDMSLRDFYRQAVPMVDNGCAGQPVLLTGKAKLGPGSTQVFLNGTSGLKELRSADHMIDLRFSDPSIHETKSTVWYFSGRKERFDLEQSDRIDTGGRYLFELRDEGDWRDLTLMGLEVDAPENMPEGLTVEATVCRRHDGSQRVASN